MSSDGKEKKAAPPPWQGWVKHSIQAPSSGPLPLDWPSVEDVKGLLAAAGSHWDSAGLQPPSTDGLLFPLDYVRDGETTDEAVERFVVDWRRKLRNPGLRYQPDMYPSSDSDLQEFLDTGVSGAYSMPLKLEVVILAKDAVFGCHTHPTLELETTLRGALGEVRLVPRDPGICVEISHRGPWEDFKGPSLVDLCGKYSYLPKENRWKVMDLVGPESFLFNEVGMIHKTYNSGEDGAFMVLWGGRHANIAASEEGTEIPGSSLLAINQT